MSLIKSMQLVGFSTLVFAGGVRVASAQQQIDTRLYNQAAAPPASARNYGPQQFELLPSERLMAFQRSGMMPSEYRMNLEAIGPLAPQGDVEAIEPQSLLQRELRLPPPILFNPAYITPPPANANAPQPPPPLPSAESFNLRPANVASPAPSLNPAPIDQNVWGAAQNDESTVTYYLPKKQNPSRSIAPQQQQKPAAATSTTKPAENLSKK